MNGSNEQVYMFAITSYLSVRQNLTQASDDWVSGQQPTYIGQHDAGVLSGSSARIDFYRI